MCSSKIKPPDDSDDDINLSDNEGTEIDGIYIPPPTKPVCSFDPTGPRLIITKIVNNYFKSYGPQQVLGPFHKCFNAIVGPNGSGKSNVIDSMLFVFGYRATKLRCKKVSVLLHNSSTFPNIREATVEVHFAQIIDKGGNDFYLVPDSEFVVSRTALKDNSSYYELNGRRVQFKEVGMLLKKHGIDLDHNRFLILQGEVEQIAMMKAKADNEHESGMLEFLEDIIGTSRYKKPLLQLNERVETLNDARMEKVNRLKIIENEMKELKAPLDEAVDFLRTENEITNLKNTLYQAQVYESELRLKKFDEENSDIKEKEAVLLEKLNALEKEKIEKETQLEAESEKCNALLQRKNSSKEAYEKACNKDLQLQTEMEQTNKKRKKLIEQLAEERKKLEKLHDLPEENNRKIEECIRKEQEYQENGEKLREEKSRLLGEVNKQTQHLQNKKEQLETKLAPLSKKATDAEQEFKLAQSQLEICKANEENEKEKYEKLKQSLTESEALIKQHKTTVANLKEKIPQEEKKLNTFLQELQEIQVCEPKLTEEIRTTRYTVEEKKSLMQSTKSRNRVLDALLRQKSEGKCPGLFGRLGDLGAIDEKYDVAISTACGPLDNIVVDTVATAEWCIGFLKKHDIGRATFIALEKQEHLKNRANQRAKFPENVPRLYDLVRVDDERVKTAFYYALRDTLVANDLDQGSRIAYGENRYRVVTLKGDIIETSGTMSGGGKTVSRGRMGQSVKSINVDPKELAKQEAEIEKKEKMVREMREQIVGLQREINAVQPELRKMQIDYEKINMELKALIDQQPALKRQLEKQESIAKNTKTDQAKMKKLAQLVEEKGEIFENARAEASELQVQVDLITKEIEDKSLGKIKALDKNIKENVKAVDKLKSEIARLKVAVKTSERDSIKSEERIKTMEENKTTCENRLREIKSIREEIEKDAEELLKIVQKITEEVTEKETVYLEMKKTVSKLEKDLFALKSEKVELDQIIKTKMHEIRGVMEHIKRVNAKIDDLQLQEIPDEETESLKKYSEEEIQEFNRENIERKINQVQEKLKSMKPNLNVIQEYHMKQDIYINRVQELQDIREKREQMKSLYDQLRNQRKTEFLNGFDIIRKKLKEMYQMITLGGDADLELVDSFDPFNEGVIFNVRPNKKSWKRIANLSGGEKTLSSLALVFALHYYKPSPLYVMDEIDAALDFKNVSIIGHYIKERTKNAQFIVISLREYMYELSQRLVGIYKIFDCTHSITIDNDINDNSDETQNMNIGSQSQAGPSQPISQQSNVNMANSDSDNNDVVIVSEPSESCNSMNLEANLSEEVNVQNEQIDIDVQNEPMDADVQNESIEIF